MSDCERYFNTTAPGPLPHPAPRAAGPGRVLTLIRQKKYFVLHPPRQTGKTSALLALLHVGGAYRCVYIDVEAG